jgi:hypothetical protein
VGQPRGERRAHRHEHLVVAGAGLEFAQKPQATLAEAAVTQCSPASTSVPVSEALRVQILQLNFYSAVRNIGDRWGLEE